MAEKKESRFANLDALRILSMILIILLHSIDHSGVLEAAPASGAATNFYVRFTYMLTQICVNCYVMISGYFLIRSRFKFQKLVQLWMEVSFYAILIKFIFMITGEIPFSPSALLSCLVPIFTGRYWFITIYAGMYLLSPFLNMAILAMNRRQHTALCVLLFGLFSVWVSVYPAFAGMNSGGGWGVPWFTVLYVIAAWFRLHYVPADKWKGRILAWVLMSLFVAAAYCTAYDRFHIIQRLAGNWYRYDSVFACVSTIAVFAAFLNMRIESRRVTSVMTYIAPFTLGVYLIHAHANLSPYLWNKLNLPRFVGQWYFAPLQLGIVLVVFTTCIGIDILRKSTVGRLENSRAVLSFCDKVTAKVNGIMNHDENSDSKRAG